MNNNISILHLEDLESDSFLIKRLISREFSDFSYFFVENEHDFKVCLKEKSIDLILSDYDIPGYSGEDALQFVQEQYPQIPFIFVTGKMEEDTAIRSLKQGARDYVLKTKLERLTPAVRRTLHEASVEKERPFAIDALKNREERYRTRFNQVTAQL